MKETLPIHIFLPGKGERMRFKFLPLIFVFAVFGNAAFATVDVATTADGRKLNVQIDGIDWTQATKQGFDFAGATLKGVENYAGISGEIGAPTIPVLRFYALGDVTATLS